MQTSRTLLQLASKLAKQSTESIPAPYIYEPASKAPSPYSSIIIATGVGIAMAGSYKMWYWNWKKEVNQFYYDLDRTGGAGGASSD